MGRILYVKEVAAYTEEIMRTCSAAAENMHMSECKNEEKVKTLADKDYLLFIYFLLLQSRRHYRG